MYCQNGKVLLQDPVTPDADGNCPRDRVGNKWVFWACGDGTCVLKDDLCNYNLAPLCPDFSDLLYCRNRTAEKKERGCLDDKYNTYTCLDRSLKDDSGSPEDEKSRKRDTEERRIPNSPPNCTQKGPYGEQLSPCTGYYPNTCGVKDECKHEKLVHMACKDYSSYTCLSKSKAEGCRDKKDWTGLPYFQCNQSG